MKKSLIATLIAAPVLSLSSMAYAAEPVALTDVQMDSVTAGFFDTANVFQFNASPVTIAQLNIANFGYSSNKAKVDSGNSSYIRQ